MATEAHATFKSPDAKPCVLTVVLFLLAAASAVCGKTVAAWDFTRGWQGWQGNKFTEGLVVSEEGLTFQSTGNDPWLEGPGVDLPGEGTVRVRVRMKSNADTSGELFYGRTFTAGHSVRFTVNNDGQWHEHLLVIPEPLGAGTRFRLDPAAGEGRIGVSSIEVEVLSPVAPPHWARPVRPRQGDVEPVSMTSGDLVVQHYGRNWGGFVVKIDDEEIASGYQAERIGVVFDDSSQWLDLSEAEFSPAAGSCRAVVRDRGGATWQATRRFRSGSVAGSILVECEFVVDQDRGVVYLPWLTLFPGLEAFGERKTQGLFAGLEYLDDEPSSSEADVTTAEHVRRAPDPMKVTWPLMAIVYDGRYVGLVWEPSNAVEPVFDSPDRTYGSGAHVMALTGPAVGEARLENELAAHTPLRIRANEPIRIQAILIGGKGASVVPAVQKYVDLRGLPATPAFAGGLDAAVTLLAHGWLDSAINEGGIFRHAVWGESFKAGPAGDALMYIDWLVNQTRDRELARRLSKARDLGVTKMPQGQPYMSTVSHTRTPTAPFVFGGVYPYVRQRQQEAFELLRHFDEKGIKRYRPGNTDYGKTHSVQHANGLAGADVARILEAATMSADPQLIAQGLALLDKQTLLYANSVPRGAQTWEVPLHTPDILASAHMVKAYTLGYLIAGRQDYLEQARYWAWTGVPFVYLVNPTEGKIGPYATIAVLGATNWRAPSWFGRPVQWCGLVYASALHLLSQYDKDGPWDRIARGITAAGLEMTWPTTDAKRQGLLPDVFELRPQLRDGPAINPGTVQAHVPELFDLSRLYDVRKLAAGEWFLHAPCAIRDLRETRESATFTVDGWGKGPYYVLIAGVDEKPAAVTTAQIVVGPVSARPAASQATVNFNAAQRLLAITLDQPCEIRVQF
ncbi:MAG: hypothetical protein JW955_03400 [Sedimentisphaerales bacterium]|nr:hypothetical protein [Sedimentisphaerales bacterium]